MEIGCSECELRRRAISSPWLMPPVRPKARVIAKNSSSICRSRRPGAGRQEHTLALISGRASVKSLLTVTSIGSASRNGTDHIRMQGGFPLHDGVAPAGGGGRGDG